MAQSGTTDRLSSGSGSDSRDICSLDEGHVLDLAGLTQVIWTLQNYADMAALVGDDHHRVLAWTEQTETRVSRLGQAGQF